MITYICLISIKIKNVTNCKPSYSYKLQIFLKSEFRAVKNWTWLINIFFYPNLLSPHYYWGLRHFFFFFFGLKTSVHSRTQNKIISYIFWNQYVHCCTLKISDDNSDVIINTSSSKKRWHPFGDTWTAFKHWN